ncbi:MAG: response regulator, partial [Lachnospiraceae bacterium]|nr:response regulator [Lachnospiraceae bacterium]
MNYIIEPLLAVIPLNVILTFYLRRVYREAGRADRQFLLLNYAVLAELFVDAFYCAALSGLIRLPAAGMLGAAYLRQGVFGLTCAALMEYLILNEDNALDMSLRFARRILFGAFFYFAIVLYFAGRNAHIENGSIDFENGRLIFSLVFPLLFVLLTALSVFLQKDRQPAGRLKVCAVVLCAGIALFLLRYYFLPQLLGDALIASCILYICLFALETPSYTQVERALHDLEKAQEEAEEADKRAHKADAEMSEFLANISHEIRTPLTTILGMDELILQKNPTGEIRTRAHDIESAGQSLIHIINDILDFSKIESGELELLTRPYHLGQVLRDVDNMIAIRAAEKGLVYISEADPMLPDELTGDRIRIQQIMVNLLNNGVKYTRQGEVKLLVTGERASDPSYLTLHITVSDTGMGIREEDMEKLFKNFTRINPEQTHDIEGTGLGLAITGRLIELMGGTVDVQSTYGEGTTFAVRIPQRVHGKATLQDFGREGDVPAVREREVFTAPGRELLIVDDNRMNRVVLQALLKETEVSVDQADSGAQALELCKEKRYDLIL